MNNFFNKSSVWLRTDTRYLATGGFWLFLGKGVDIVSGLILAVAFANLLPLEIFGTYQFILSMAAVAGAFTLTRMNTAIAQAVSRDFEGSFRVGVFTKLKWSLGIAAVSIAIALYYFINDNYTLGLSMLIVGAFSPFLESFKLYNAFLVGKQEFRTSVLFGIWRKLIPLLAIVCTILLTDNVITLVLVYFLAHVLVVVILYWQVVRIYQPKQKADPLTVNYSKHLSATDFLSVLSTNLDKILVFHYLGAAQLAIYSFALMPVKQLHSVSGVLQTLTLPKFSTRNIEEIKDTLPRKAFILFVVMSLVVIAYILAAPFLYGWFFPQYIDSIFFSQVVALMLLSIPAIMLGQVFVAHRRKKEIYTVGISISLLRIILILILLPLYGIWGAIAVKLLVHAFDAALESYLFVKLK